MLTRHRGRPSRTGLPACYRVEVRFDPLEWNALERTARANNVKRTDLVRAAVNWFMSSLAEGSGPALVIGGTVLGVEAPADVDLFPTK